MIDLNELQAFVHVARRESFTDAAKNLELPKSSVSRAIARLEERLGVRLLRRTTRSVSLTEAGRAYFERCQRVMDEAEDAESFIGALQEKPRGHLRVAAPVAFARAFLGPIVSDFLALYPEVRLSVQMTGMEQTHASDQLDLIIRPGPLEDSDLLAKSLMRLELGLFASPQYLKVRGKPTSPADLREHACIGTSCTVLGKPAEHLIWRLRRKSETQELRIYPRVAVPDPAIGAQLALAGAGIAILSAKMMRRLLAEKRLVRVLPEWAPDTVELFGVYPTRLAESPKVRVFLQFLLERLESAGAPGKIS